MKLHLFTLLLFTGVLPLVLSFSRKYFLIQEPKTWDDARAYCRATYTDLAVITTSTELSDLQNVALAQGFSSSAWVGLSTNMNSWRWIINNEPLGSFTAWNSGEPNNGNNLQICGCISAWVWCDAQCTALKPVLCLDDRPTATEKYVLIQQPMTWFDAQSYCRQFHTDLPSVRNAAENSAVGGKDPSKNVWLGLRREPWKWTDQTTDVSVITWAGGDGNDYLQNRSCVYINNGQADQEQCSVPMPFFCYIYPVQKKTIRMKMQSSQDVNDPAVISDIEGKLKEKLRKYGMAENITVTWRKQPNGDVFHKEENITGGINATEDCDGLYFVQPSSHC